MALFRFYWLGIKEARGDHLLIYVKPYLFFVLLKVRILWTRFVILAAACAITATAVSHCLDLLPLRDARDTYPFVRPAPLLRLHASNPCLRLTSCVHLIPGWHLKGVFPRVLLLQCTQVERLGRKCIHLYPVHLCHLQHVNTWEILQAICAA
ncbi:unnamed protein product [Chrysoparadoxa australica]